MSDIMGAFESIQASIPTFVPVFAALCIVSILVLVSHIFKGEDKIFFQGSTFAAIFAVTCIYIRQTQLAAFNEFWAVFSGLSSELRFCVSLVAITATYFGAAMYVTQPDSASGSLESPACCDNNIGFDLPETLPGDDKELFESIFATLKNDFVEDLPTVYEMGDEATEYIDRMIEYTVAGGKMNRGLAAMTVQKDMAKAQGRELSRKERVQSAALGWCIEFLQAFFLVADDVMDDSVTRRGQPCWFRKPDVKLVAINDSFILESCVYKILKKYFGKEAYYSQLVDLFIEVTRQTELGQLMDLTSTPVDGDVDLDRFTIERYMSIVTYKTAFYSFYLPVALGMIVSGVTDKKAYNKAREILIIMGVYFQIQDDYLDCYGKPEVIGKIGTDIQDAKCSWLVVQAIDKCKGDDKMMNILKNNYGKFETKKVNAVKKLYNDLDLESEFKQYEEKSYEKIQSLLEEVREVPRVVFDFLLNKIYKRTK